jgi:hypothetical protein
MMTLYYTYSHAKPDGSIFYIGKGVENRAHGFSSRNRYWKRVVAKHGKPTVQILANWKTEQEAFEHEMFLIDCFKGMGFKLANITKGGDGVAGLKWTTESKLKLSKSKLGVRFVGRGATSVKRGDKLDKNRADKMRAILVEARAKMKPKTGVPMAKVECPHCQKIGGVGAMGRWHFDNCKDKQ